MNFNNNRVDKFLKRNFDGEFPEEDEDVVLYYLKGFSGGTHTSDFSFKGDIEKVKRVLNYKRKNGDLLLMGRGSFSGKNVYSHVLSKIEDEFDVSVVYQLPAEVFGEDPHQMKVYRGKRSNKEGSDQFEMGLYSLVNLIKNLENNLSQDERDASEDSYFLFEAKDGKKHFTLNKYFDGKQGRGAFGSIIVSGNGVDKFSRAFNYESKNFEDKGSLILESDEYGFAKKYLDIYEGRQAVLSSFVSGIGLFLNNLSGRQINFDKYTITSNEDGSEFKLYAHEPIEANLVESQDIVLTPETYY